MKLAFLCTLELDFDDRLDQLRTPRRDGGIYGTGSGVRVGDRLSGRIRWTNHPRIRADGTTLPDMHGVIEVGDGSTVLVVSSKVIAASAGFAQRNVREGLSQLYDAGVLTVVEMADDRQYGINADHWAALLDLETTPSLPFHYDWIPAMRALATILRWLDQPGLDELSDYMQASQARTLLDTIEAPCLCRAFSP
jgi:hypothetical protein